MSRTIQRLVLTAACGLLLAAVLAPPARAKRRVRHLLVVTYTTGFRHSDSIPVAEEIIKNLGQQSGLFDVDYARTAEEVQAKMTPQALRAYDGVFFAQTTGDLGLPDRDGFLDYIKAGHGFIGTHSATDTYHDWPGYIDMIGAEFVTHGPQVEVQVNVEDRKHPAVRAMPADHRNGFRVFDEIYELKNFSREKSHVILAMSQHPQTHQPGDYWVSWDRCYGKGKVFYMSLGHRPEVWRQQWYQDYLLGGIKWVLGLARGSCTPSAALAAARPRP